ncbi:MAG TPA: HEAT repeat domain-containing protein, partial [Spirochaetota bacterium]|nr:HEAT repeat domain-containing protein [Spirochaetota bacterium]
MAQPSNTLEQIIENIHAGDDSTRNKGFENIIECGSEAIVPLITLLAHPDEQMRDSAVWALCQMNDVAGPILIQELLNKNPLIRESASFCMGICKNKDASQALLLLLKDENEKVRETAAWSLVKIGVDDENTVKQIIACLDDESVLVKDTAQWILEHIGESAFEPLFQKLMESSFNSERIIHILSIISSDKIDALLQLLETTQDIQKLSYLIQLIGQLRDPQSIECLLPFLNHSNRHIITHTVEALI